MRSAHADRIAENKQLKKRLESAERENLELKRSLYEISTRLSAALARPSCNPGATRPSAPQLDVDTGASLAVDDSSAIAVAMAAQEPRGGSSPTSRGAHHKRGTGGGEGSGDGRGFEPQLDLKGHTGAVYAVRYSPNGRLLASGSFDHTVRCWNRGEEVACLREHSHNVSDVRWSADSALLLSGSFDHTMRLWDVARSECLSCFEVGRAFVLSVALHSSDVCSAAASNGQLLHFDRRRGEKPILSLQNDCLINSIALSGDHTVLSGDKRGVLKAWDLRTGRCLRQQPLGDPQRPISHVEVSPEVAWRGQQASRLHLLAVNSYDDTLRVLTDDAGADEGGGAGAGAVGAPAAGRASGGGGAAPGDGGAADGGGLQRGGWRQLCELRGHKNRSWPIRSSFSVGETCARVVADEDDVASRWQTHEAALVATGSTDGRAYLYAVNNAPGGATSELVQVLEGHSDRVYATSFHPQEPLLATCSADFVIKVWRGPV